MNRSCSLPRRGLLALAAGFVFGTETATLAQQWDHRPDIDFSPPGEACDDEVAERYIEE